MAMIEQATRQQADEIAKATEDAYSFARYGEKSWRSCCRMLARRGLSAAEIEAVMRSKWTRWAHDMSDKPYGKVNSADLARFLDTDTTDLKASIKEQLLGRD